MLERQLKAKFLNTNYARKAAYSPPQLLDHSLEFLASHAHEAEKRRLQERIGELQRAAETGDPASAQELETTLMRLAELHRRGIGEPATA